VGVDVEPVRAFPDAAAVVERFFSPRERQAYRACAPGERLAAFFTLWTRKEAYVKALGLGLSLDLAGFAVSLDQPARVVSPAPGAPVPGPVLCDIPVPAGHVGALAGWFARIVCRDVALFSD
jgi:4'-phosphopantetheinyl transferase